MNLAITSVLRAAVRALGVVIPKYILLKPQRKGNLLILGIHVIWYLEKAIGRQVKFREPTATWSEKWSATTPGISVSLASRGKGTATGISRLKI